MCFLTVRSDSQRSESPQDGATVLTSACAQCHNPRLDQTVRRARFRADLQGMTRAEKDIAIQRMQLLAEHPQAMLPRDCGY